MHNTYCMCVRVCMHIHTHTYVCVHTYAYIHINAYACVHVAVYACFLCVSVSVCTRVRECINFSKKIAHPQIHTNIPSQSHAFFHNLSHIYTKSFLAHAQTFKRTCVFFCCLTRRFEGWCLGDLTLLFRFTSIVYFCQPA